ncbi:MAG: outer membrane beta-barrel protein [Bacteroidota bacterium]
MKKALILFVLLFLLADLSAQLRIGINGGYYNTSLLNSSIKNAEDLIDPDASFGEMYGLSGMLLFGETTGLAFAINVLNIEQNLTGDIQYNVGPSVVTERYELDLEIAYTSIPILFHAQTPNGWFFQAGPQFNFTNTAKEAFRIVGQSSLNEINEIDDQFENLVVAIEGSFGKEFSLSEKLKLNIALNGSIGLTDAVKQVAEEEINSEDFPAFILASHMGIVDDSPIAVDQGEYSYASSNFSTLGIKTGIHYQF